LKQLLLILIICSAFNSCKEEDEAPNSSNTQSPQQVCKIKNEIKINVIDSTVFSKVNFLYDSLLSNRLVAKEILDRQGLVGLVRRFNYRMNEEVLDIVQSANGDAPYDTTNTLEFDGLGNLTSVSSFLVGSSYTLSYKFFYTGSQLTSFQVIDNQASYTETWRVQMRNGNIISSERFRINGQPTNSTLEIQNEYDLFPNPYFKQSTYSMDLIKYFSRNSLKKSSFFENGIKTGETINSASYSASNCPIIIQSNRNNSSIERTEIMY